MVQRLILLLLLSTVFVFLACSQEKQDRGAVVMVNKAPIYASELQREIADYARLNPAQKITDSVIEDRLNTLIEKKLMIQEGVKRGVTKDRHFMETIKKFWEQTLIRELLDAKGKEMFRGLYVTDDEVLKAYERMQCRPHVRFAKAANRKAADRITASMRNGNHAAGERTIAPLFYEDVGDSPLINAFDMNAGEVKAYPMGTEYVVICVTAKGSMPMPPIEEVSSQIRESMLAQKKQRAISEWIKTIRESSAIQINNSLLKGICHERNVSAQATELSY
jgi:hypothetical protein